MNVKYTAILFVIRAKDKVTFRFGRVTFLATACLFSMGDSFPVATHDGEFPIVRFWIESRLSFDHHGDKIRSDACDGEQFLANNDRAGPKCCGRRPPESIARGLVKIHHAKGVFVRPSFGVEKVITPGDWAQPP